MNPFKHLTRLRFVHTLLRWRPLPSGEIPIERPPRSRPARGRLRVHWHGDLSHPFPFETEDRPRSGDPDRW